ncbi:alpha/beta fold hydrolase [Streptomyces sp. NPDC052727]|uniref:alpha/beta fold hydrolase n=1 Tax=Streptomyces sp. NPDC052727 TaxID=3154854 RepID=UPI00343A5B3E
MTTQPTAPLAPGAHTIEVDGTVQAYHVHGTGPVCVAHPGGPGIPWEYLRMPAAERHLTMVYAEPIGTGASGRLPRHPDGYVRARYSRFLEALIDHLGVGPVHLLGHSHGGFVVQYHALHHPGQVAGVILYDSAPVTGREHGAEAMRQVQAFAARHADRPELPAVLAALQSVPAARDDAGITAALRGLLLVVDGEWRADLHQAVGLGVRAVLPRAGFSWETFTQTVRQVRAGHGDLPPALQGRLMDQMRYTYREVLVPRGLTPGGLTEREAKVLRLVADGHELQDIGNRLGYSERTIKNVLYGVIKRHRLRNRAHAVSFAIRSGLI